MVSCTLVSSLLSYLPFTNTRHSLARVFSDTPSPSQAFEAKLVDSLQKLTHDTHGDSSSSDLISFNWMCKALNVALSTQESAKHALSTHTRSAVGGLSDKEMKNMMQQYMEDSVKMLDVCCLLKETLAGADAYLKAAYLALKHLHGLKLVNQGYIQRAKHALLSAKQVQDSILLDEPVASVRTNIKDPHSIKRLSACSSMLRRMGDKLTAPTTESLYIDKVHTASMASSSCYYSTLPAALHGGEMSTLFCLRLLSAALSSPTLSLHKSSFMAPLYMSRQAAWAPSLLSLQAQLNDEFLKVAQRRTRSCITLLPELHILDASLRRIYEALQHGFSSKKARDDMRQLVDSASMLVVDLKGSMARLQHQVDCISSSLVDIRMALLDSSIINTSPFV